MAKLAVLLVLIALLGCAACEASYGYGSGGDGGYGRSGGDDSYGHGGNDGKGGDDDHGKGGHSEGGKDNHGHGGDGNGNDGGYGHNGGGGYGDGKPTPPAAYGGLKVKYYADKCPTAEDIVRRHVRDATPGIKAGLIRMFFHDCFVRGCDASVLLDQTDPNSPAPEKLGIPNLSLRGFEVIDAAKAELEATCARTVSCADVVAFAARDAFYFLAGSYKDFDMPAGRYDGLVSLANETLPNLPPPFAEVQRLKDMFAAKGLGTEDMVVLSGAHTVGQSHCSSFSDRLQPNSGSDMNPTLAADLRTKCATGGGGGDPTVSQDLQTPDVMDNQYYRNVLNHNVLFKSDAALLNATDTMRLVYDNAASQERWQSKFWEAMVKMGGVEVKTSANGEIRTKCGAVNKPYSG